MRFGFRGLSHIVSTGCTSSTDAIGYAFRNIQAGVLRTVVATTAKCALERRGLAHFPMFDRNGRGLAGAAEPSQYRSSAG